MTHGLEARLDSYSPHVIGLFRIVIGLLFGMNGTIKLFQWPISVGDIPVGSWPVWWAGLIELVVGVLLMVGLFTRAAAFIGSGQMAVAYFTAHQSKGFWPAENGGELAVVYCFALFLLVFIGGGAWAIQRRRS